MFYFFKIKHMIYARLMINTIALTITKIKTINNNTISTQSLLHLSSSAKILIG